MHDEEAARLDALDELAPFAERFYRLPDTIYLDGNSLGLLSKNAEAAVLRVLNEWKTLAIGGWTEAQPDWFHLAEALGRQTAPLIGAAPESVIIANSTTVNLHQLLATLYEPKSDRTMIVADELNFTSDIYALQSHLRLHGLTAQSRLRPVTSADGFTLNESDIIAAMTDDVQLVVLSSVLYRSGQLLDMALLTREARKRGILIGFDLAHSIGVVPHHLDEWGVDFAFWCSYKYLNAGPGASAGLYINRRHFHHSPGLAGWFSSRKTSQFTLSAEPDYERSAAGLQIGTPNILSTAPLQGSLEIVTEAGIERIRAKSLRLTEYLMHLADTELAEYGFQTATPREPERRGGHVALRHPHAAAISRALRHNGVVPDYRPPDIVRLAPSPLYTSFAAVHEAVSRLKQIMADRAYESEPDEAGLVP